MAWVHRSHLQRRFRHHIGTQLRTRDSHGSDDNARPSIVPCDYLAVLLDAMVARRAGAETDGLREMELLAVIVIRHAPLLPQIGLIVILGLGAISFTPIGLDRLFPLNGDRVCYRDRQWWSGLLLLLLGLGSLSGLLGLIFLA